MLSFQVFGTGSRQALLIHGIMGSSRNLATFAKLLVSKFPDWQLILPDLRHHGDSGFFEGPNTVAVCAQDVLELVKDQNFNIEMIIGHSFGGKVAMALNELMPVRQVWILDVEPGLKRPSHTDEIVKKLTRIPMPQPTRIALQSTMLELGLPRHIALWMTTNVRDTPDGLMWKFDLKIIKELLISFAKTEFSPRENTDFVKAERNSHMLMPLSEKVHLLQNAGHWVHIDNPKGLLEILRPSLLAPSITQLPTQPV
ncbi:MAG: alpha/beta fold hydrolase [Myxococcota bacterium]